LAGPCGQLEVVKTSLGYPIVGHRMRLRLCEAEGLGPVLRHARTLATIAPAAWLPFDVKAVRPAKGSVQDSAPMVAAEESL
jgi:uncharacterized membrane protein (DUF2068 family)